jgi:DNA-nicking Smr family endonuclease
MDASLSVLFLVLEYNKNLPKLDLHGVRPQEVEVLLSNFLTDFVSRGEQAVQVIYGRGGSGVLKQKTIELLDRNLREKDKNNRFVKAWKEAVLEGSGGRCLVILEG